MINMDTLKVFLSRISVQELIALRHDAVRLNDEAMKKLVDEEMKKRLNV